MNIRGKSFDWPIAAILLSVCFLWVLILTTWPVPFWQSYDEYAYQTLADASNFNIWLRTGKHYEDSGLVTHPGVPFYFISFICFRAVALFGGHTDIVAETFARPEDFFLATRIAAGTIAILSLIFTWRILAPASSWARALAIACFFTIDPWSSIYGLSFLGCETFALPLACLLFWSVKRILAAPSDLRSWVLAGAVAAAGYLVKLTYIYNLVGVLVLLVIITTNRPGTVRERFNFFARGAGTMLFAFAALSAIVMVAVAGPNGLKNLLTVHASFLFPARPEGSIAVDVMQKNVERLAQGSALLPVTLLAFGALLFDLYSNWNIPARRSWNIVAIAVLGFACLAVLNHFSPYYVTAITALIPFSVIHVLDRRPARIAATALVVIAGYFTALALSAAMREMSVRATGMLADEQEILSMPLSPGEARLWSYRTPSRYFAAEMSLQLAGLQEYFHRAYPLGQDISSYANLQRPYRYIVFDRGYHPTIDGIKQASAHNTLIEPNGMKIQLSPAVHFRLLKSTIVAENPP